MAAWFLIIDQAHRYNRDRSNRFNMLSQHKQPIYGLHRVLLIMAAWFLIIDEAHRYNMDRYSRLTCYHR